MSQADEKVTSSLISFFPFGPTPHHHPNPKTMTFRDTTALTALLSVACLFMFSSVSRAFVPFAVSPSKNNAFGLYSKFSLTQSRRHYFHMSATSERKAGVASPEELKAFVAQAGSRLLVVDVRNPDPAVEPGDQKSLAVAPIPSGDIRPQGVHLIYDRNTKSMPLPDVDKDTPIITHCGGGGRGQQAKDFLMESGFTNVLNGGGPKEKECWAEFGDK
jgi:rhodanese-related sulfurtransferase